jgi:uncharacterized protein YgiM (DUF1202 family)
MRSILIGLVVLVALVTVPAPTNTAHAQGVACTPRYDWTTIHTVARGETAFRIARRYGITVPDLAAGNCLSNASRIFAGQQLRVPGGSTNPPGGNAYVTESWVRMRSGPGFTYAVIHYLNREAVTLLGRSYDSNWLYVRASNGQEGWVYSYLVVVNDMGITALPVMQ